MKVTVKLFGHSHGSVWHNGRFFSGDQIAGKTFSVYDSTESSCYLLELGHHFARWMLNIEGEHDD